MADVDDGEEAGAKDSGPAIMSRGGQHGDVHHLDSFLRGTDDWHQPLGAESYETEDEGEEAREGSAEADMDAEEAELSGGAPSTPDKTADLRSHQFGENTLDGKKRKSTEPSPVWMVIKRLKDENLKKDVSPKLFPYKK